MKTYRFKTSIHCNSCLSRVTPFLDADNRIISWEVDLNDPDRILKVETNECEASDIIEIVDNIGYDIELL